MSRRSPLRSLTVIIALIACRDSTGPSVPNSVALQSAVPGTSVVGTTLTVAMKVADARGKGVHDMRLKFVTTAGDGSVSPEIVTTDGDGVARADWTIGQTAGTNTLIATMDLPFHEDTVTVTGTASAAVAATIVPHVTRIPSGSTSATVKGSLVDQFGNSTSGSVVFTSRNPGLVKIDSLTGAVTVVSGTGTTYIVVSGSSFRDSSYVIVLGPGDPPCTGLSTKASLGVGEVMTTGFTDNATCIAATTTTAEYALVPYFDSSVPSANTAVFLRAFNVKNPSTFADIRRAGMPTVGGLTTRQTLGATFEGRLDAAARHELPPRAAAARAWYSGRIATRKSASLNVVVPKAGDRMTLNTNATAEGFCSDPQWRTGRVVAVTQRAVVVADTANPTGGFTDAEYAAYGAAFDTISYPLDVANFGEPTDIDNNGGRIIIFFSHAVNEADQRPIGFFNVRDLLPRSGSAFGSCSTSNVAELINLWVPDNITPKAFVASKIVETMSHEFQHLINGARRLYINKSAALMEERWLNEGLSHIAEELTFYRVSGLTPGQNIGSSAVSSTTTAQIFNTYAKDNFDRLTYYLTSPESQSPVATGDEDDDFGTRGAIWSYLRYVADQRFAQTERLFWSKLVNSNTAGLQNLYDVIGTDARSLMRDWTLAIFLDDLSLGVSAKYQMSSWNYRQIASYPPFTRFFNSNGALSVSLSAGGTAFARFAVSANNDAYVSAGGTSGTQLPPHVLLALVRTK